MAVLASLHTTSAGWLMQPAHQPVLDGLVAIDGGRQAVGQLLQHGGLLGQLVDVPVGRRITAGSRSQGHF